MAERTSGRWLWWTAGGVIFLISIASKNFWSTFVILCGAEGAAYFLIWMSREKEASANPNSSGNTQESNHEVTLTELVDRAPREQVNAGVTSLMSTASSAIASASKAPNSTEQRQFPTPWQEPRADTLLPSPLKPLAPLSSNSLAARNSAAASDDLAARSGQNEKFYSTQNSPGAAPSSYAIPQAPAAFRNTRWVLPGESIEIAGVSLNGGMIYVGARMDAPNGRPDPCLVNGLLPVAHVGDCRICQMGYWPSYATASSSERRAYLNWLAEGRSNPDCDIGYVFLFFYGLERRIILDSGDDQAAKKDWPDIIDELRRLLTIYGEKSGSFNHYAGELLSWIELDGMSGRLYQKPIPNLPQSYELPPYLRVALGQAALDRAPLPASLALTWVQLSPEIHLRTAAVRCPDAFRRLFTQRYQKVFGNGLVLRKNRTKLKFVYRAAPAGLLGVPITMDFGDIPDVTAVTAPINALRDIANQCTDELGPYSRLVGKDPSLADTLEGFLLLPTAVWPEETKAKLDTMVGRVSEGSLTLTLQELFASLGGMTQAPTRDRIRGLAQVLEDIRIGMEPNVLGGVKVPGGMDKVVLFVQPASDARTKSGVEYQTAALTLQLGAALAQADGDFSEQEINHLRAKVDGWPRLTPADRCRLRAHLQLLVAAPPNLTALKRKLEPLDTAARETIAMFMVTVAQSDGYVSPDEVKFLEKLYKALGIESKRVFSDVQAAGTNGSHPMSAARAAKQSFHLDADRIAALQKDTARVSTLLSKIFVEEASAPETAVPDTESSDAPPSLLGLDERHSAFTRLLLSRPQWTRGELEDAAADLDLMLDGALEQVNEAAFDAFDEPLCEGDDPIDVNAELLEKIAT